MGKAEALDRMNAEGSGDDEAVEGMSSGDEGGDDDDIFGQSKDDKEKHTFLDSVDTSGLSEKEKRAKLKMAMVNKRLDDLIEVLDNAVADLQADSKALSKVKNSLKTVQQMSRLTDRERQDFRLYIEVIAFIANKKNPG